MAAAAALVVSVSAARAEIQPRAEAVVEHYLGATGGRAAREQERTLHFKGRIEADGLSGRWEMWLEAPDRWMRRFELGSLRFREGFDGAQAWRTDLANKSVVPLSEAETGRARQEGWFLNERWALADQGGGQIRARSESFRGGKVLDAIEVIAPGGHSRQFFIDRKSGLIEREISEVDHHAVEEAYGRYQMLGGRKRPSAYTSPTLIPTDKPIERLTVDSVWVNPTVASGLFSPPAIKERSIAWTRAPGSIRVPFVYVSRAVLVKVSINGAPPREFILDTGATLTVLDRDYARTIGLHPEGDASIEGIAASAKMEFARVRSIRLAGPGSAGTTLRDFRVALLDLTHDEEIMLWRKPTGILGADFLSRFVVGIDYDSLMVTLNDQAGYRYQGVGAALPFQLYQGIPIVELTVDNGCSGRFLVDVGNAFHFVVHGSLVRSCRIIGAKKRQEVEVSGGGAGGGFVSTLCRLDSLRIGPYAWTEPIAALALHRRGILGSNDLAGNIGNSVLERFRVTIDYAGHVLYLEPGRRFPEREHVSRFGALWARVGERVFVGNVMRGSAAYEAGLRWYDEIVAVDGKPLEKWSRQQVEHQLEQGPVGAVHKVTYRRMDDPEETIELTLKDPL